MYTDCGRKYKFHYVDKYREKYFHSALGFGSAIDNGLNTLLETRDFEKGKAEFDKTWAFQYVNGKVTALARSEYLVYAEKDFDKDLLTPEDIAVLEVKEPFEYYEKIKEMKSLRGFDNLTVEERQFYNHMNWLCLRRKGYVMMKAYNEKILPKIKNVLAVQHKFQLENNVGDTIVAVADMIVEWEDGRILLLDNKTSSREYEADQAARSAQLIVYYHKLKEEFKINSVGFIVMNKNISKNKTKICSSCGNDGSGGRHKTCAVETDTGRCNGAWLEKINPDCYIQTIINEVTDTAEELVLTTFDEANTGIKQEMFYRNLSACKRGPIVCPFYRVCWHNDMSDVTTAEERK